jgi:hypothetical protein
MDEFETASTQGHEPAAQDDEGRTLFSGSLLPESMSGVIRRLILMLLMGPGMLGILWIFGRIIRR